MTRPRQVWLLAAVMLAASAVWASSTSPAGPQGDTWASIAQLPDFSGAWFRPDFGPGARGGARPQFAGEYAEQQRLASNDATLVNNAIKCLPDGMPLMMSVPYSYEILLTPKQVTIISEDRQVRRIFTDGRSHPADPDPTFSGHSIGHWNDGVLLVDTVGIIKDAELARGVKQSGETHVIERIFKKSPGTLQIDTEVTDPAALKAPYSYSYTYQRTPVGRIEYVCEQNNLGNHEFPAASPAAAGPGRGAATP